MNKIAILYQFALPPVKAGIQKPMKPGGYSDSGADIAFELIKNKKPVLIPTTSPDMEKDKDWVYPDTKCGIEMALKAGATVFWLNTVLFQNHPIENFFDREIRFVGQTPASADIYDDKFFTNKLLKSEGIPIPDVQLISFRNFQESTVDLDFPLVVKPLRGRGSQGVVVVNDRRELTENLATFFIDRKYGDAVYLEQYLSGQEITISVMPKGNYRINNQIRHFPGPWCLPAVKRFNHHHGIAPYNGLVAVIENSAVLTDKELASEEIREVYSHCSKAAELLQIKAPIRIDCRANEKGEYFLFDLNLKPNMTGPSRNHRKDQDSLTLMAARKIGWDYFDLLNNMLDQSWKASCSL